MTKKIDIFENYTSTSMLTGGGESALTDWSIGYFNTYIVPHLPSRRDSRILEIGCGYGRYLLAMEKLEYTDVYGIDISKEQVEYAQQKLGLMNISKEDALNFLEVSHHKYDVILLLDVLEHLELDYAIRLISLIRSTLNPDGVFIVQVPNAMSPLSPNRHWDITHLRAYTTHSMEQNLRLGGFTSICHYELPTHIYSISSLVRKVLWFTVLRPLIASYMLVANSGLMGGIFTTNMLTVAHKRASENE